MVCSQEDGDIAFQYPLSGLDRLLRKAWGILHPPNFSFNTLCRVLIGCYIPAHDMPDQLTLFQYPLSGLDRLLPLWVEAIMHGMERFNTLCRVLIGCYTLTHLSKRQIAEVSIPSVGS